MKCTHCTASLLGTVVLQISVATELVVQVVQVAFMVQVGRALNQEQPSPVRSLLTEGVGECNEC